MSSISADRVLKMMIGGAVGGYLTYLILDPSIRAEENGVGRVEFGDFGRHLGERFIHVVMVGAVVGMVIGVCLIIAEELPVRNPLRLARGLVLGGFIGATIGCMGTMAANIIFALFTVVGLMILGRILGWAIMGAAAGLCPGIVAQSPVRIRQGVIGGLIGGGMGGALFDLLAAIMGGGSASRMTGFVLMGAAIGAAVSLIEELGKEFWLKALSGSKEGRSFILSRPITVMGRDELTDVPLFGDPAVLKRHALLVRAADAITLQAESGAHVTVNDQPVVAVRLGNGDILGIGRHRLLFQSRHTSSHSSSAPPMPPRDIGSSLAAAPLSTAFPNRVEVLSGPHAGQVYPIAAGAILGRDPRCDIALVNDGRASRQHARLALGPDGWVIEDGGSTNGTYVNGRRISLEPLHSGDQIGVGDSLMQIV